MNLKKLKQAEKTFFNVYPEGFADPAMEQIGKRHKVDQMTTLCQEAFKKTRFTKFRTASDDMVKMVGRSSMVSMFEKPKFRDFVAGLDDKDRRKLTNSLKAFLHGTQQKGFEDMVELLAREKLAKWSIVTIIPNYFHPLQEVFVKPTTAKGVIKYFELEGLEYKPRPSWAFYEEYRRQILHMRSKVDSRLAPNNAAFCGFLMMTMKQPD